MAAPKKKNCDNIQLLLCMCLLLKLGAASVLLTLESDIPGENNVLCNSKAVLICTIQQYTIMTWTINEEVVADCTYKTGQTYITGSADYAFSFDTNNGTFNITMDPVKFAEHGKTFKCDDGLTSSSIVLNVNVSEIPDSSRSMISILKQGPSTNIQVTTGCTFSTSNTNFEWFIFEEGGNTEPHTFNTSIQSTTEYGCTSGQCGGKGVVKITDTLTVHEDPNGRNIYFQVRVKHRFSTDVIIRSDKPLKLNGDALNLTSLFTDISGGSISIPSYTTFIVSILWFIQFAVA